MVDDFEAQRDLFCRTFLETHHAFEPANLPWPVLDDAAIDRLRAIPFWDAALRAERNAGVTVSGFAALHSDPLIRQALALQGIEETRHAAILDEMLHRYKIPVADLPAGKVTISERAFIDFGYEECIDSFFGFGIFGLARRIKFFVPELTDIFEFVLREEARHVIFFVSWLDYKRRLRRRDATIFQAFATAYGYLRAVRRIVSTFAPSARNAKMKGVAFAAEGAFKMFSGITWRTFLQSCVDENDRYLAAMDSRLLRPRVLPAIARLLLSLPSFGPLRARRTTRRRNAPSSPSA